ncbi:regulator of G protein signaling superfamily [Tothia fuscella]|uniref:Regulator of G protein signaling superfamily n=1 Tax=Tothia fuscella TaxID=1048955 RepID=A0A9P4NGU9_9PEZI|nr:regulator of G protein signaling superfamily [Tothia fuscella]
MSTRKSIRPSLKVKTNSPSIVSSPTLSQEFSDCKENSQSVSEISDDKPAEMTEFINIPSRPLSVAIPRQPFGATGPYCPRRPNLSAILNNTSPSPWTLSAFMAYLSQNHCLETLEFTMDASRYRKHYNKMASRSTGGQLVAGSEECAYVQSLWSKLLEAYIVPNGPREVNIPSEVRDSLIQQSNADIPPRPDSLDIAVQKVYELMEESVLVPFLNSFYPQTAQPDSAHTSNEDLPHSAYPGGSSYDDRTMYRRSRRIQRSSPPLSQSIPISAPPIPNRASAPSSFSQFARTLSHSARHISQSSSGSQSARPTSQSPADMSAGGLTDDTSASSPSAIGEPMTPPTTPPQCDYQSPHASSPLNMSLTANYGARSKSEIGAWKKVRSSFGFRKKSGSLREEEVDQATGHLV